MKTSTLLTLLFTSLTSTLVSAQPVLLDSIAVVVNDNVITKTQVEKEKRRFLQSLPPEKREIPDDILRNEVLGNLVDEELKIQEATKRNIKIDNITLNREIETIAKKENLSINEFYDKIVASGIDYAEFREKLRRDIAIQQLFARVIRSRVKISNQAITDFLNSDLNQEINNGAYNLSHIVINLPETASDTEIEQADAEITRIYEDLIKGKDFAQTAKTVSDSDTAVAGGKLGWLTRADLPSRFMQVILEMEDNNISKPFRTTTGFNILKLNDIRGIKKHMVDEVNARHILVKTTAIVDTETALNKINDIHAAISKGADFGKTAKASSDDKGSGANNGKLGWAPPSIYVPEFRSVVNDIPLNKVSQPFKTQFGWHILEVLGRRSVDKTISKKRRDARYTLLTRKAKEQEQIWINQLRSKAYIDIRDQKI